MSQLFASGDQSVGASAYPEMLIHHHKRGESFDECTGYAKYFKKT